MYSQQLKQDMVWTNFCVVKLYMEVNNSSQTWHVVICAVNSNNTEKVSKNSGDPEALISRTLTKFSPHKIETTKQKKNETSFWIDLGLTPETTKI